VTGVTVRAPAKINLQLAVGPRRADGYHDLVTVFQAISLYDDVTVAEAGPGGDRVLVSGEGADEVPAGPENLALKAAAALALAAGLPRDITGPIEITIRKRIPVAAGLAGGSADAAKRATTNAEITTSRPPPNGLRPASAASAGNGITGAARAYRSGLLGTYRNVDSNGTFRLDASYTPAAVARRSGDSSQGSVVGRR
jgi:hypothetical protein